MDLSELNEAQKQAVTYEGKHLLVLAGAGTGKTKTITYRASYLLSKGVPSNKILILSFTRKAAHEIVSRIKNHGGSKELKGVEGLTFHSWCNKLLYRFPSIFQSKGVQLLDEDDQQKVMSIVCKRNPDAMEKLRLNVETLTDLYSYTRNTKSNLSTAITKKLLANKTKTQIANELIEIKPFIETIFRDYHQKKIEKGYFDFDDLLIRVATVLERSKEAREIITSEYDHILVDEMQDTNPLQWDLLNQFKDNTSLFCVGDDAQSIYAFRGADFRNIHQFKTRVEGAHVVKLEQNYRSNQEILDVSNWLLEKSPLAYDKKLQAVRGKAGYLPTVLNVQDEYKEADWVSDKILRDFHQDGKKFSQNLVLVRSMQHALALEASFVKNKIPYQNIGGRKFLESAHLRDLISALRVVNNFNDEIAWERFLTLWKNIGAVTAHKIASKVGTLNNVEEITDLINKEVKSQDVEKITAILSAVDKNRLKVKEALLQVYENMESTLANKYKLDWDQKRKSDVPVLTKLSENYNSIGEFITDSILLGSSKTDDGPLLNRSELSVSEKKDIVTISTIHSAKGLEADTCYVLNVSPKTFPSANSLNSIDEIEEERRVLYVALTRPMNELIITRKFDSIYANEKKVKDGEETTKSEVYFLNSLPGELVNQEGINQHSTRVLDSFNIDPFDFPDVLNYD